MTADPKDQVLLASMEELARCDSSVANMSPAEISSSRSLRQEELDGYYRYQFVMDVVRYIDDSKTARFVIVGKLSGLNRLVEISKRLDGEWHFTLSGKGSMYTYKFGDLIHYIEQLWDNSERMLFLDGEIQLKFEKVTANPDAEPDTIA